MRKLLLASGLFFCTTAANADPYPWCLQNKAGIGGGVSCYFMTLEQCQASVGINGISCHRNAAYDGKSEQPETSKRRSKNRDR